MDGAEKTCPRCAETIKAAAVVCRFCGHEFDQQKVAPVSPAPLKTNLRTCPKCGKIYANSHKACPHCNGISNVGKGCLGVIGIVLFISLIGLIFSPGDKTSPGSQSGTPSAGASSDSAPAQAAAVSCSDDWTKCKDNADLVNNYSRWSNAQVACKIEATDRAKYGTPIWPWIIFGSFLKGDAYVKTGNAVAIEKDAQFQNGFGAMVHSTVICTYDLRAEKVTAVDIEGN